MSGRYKGAAERVREVSERASARTKEEEMKRILTKRFSSHRSSSSPSPSTSTPSQHTSHVYTIASNQTNYKQNVEVLKVNALSSALHTHRQIAHLTRAERV